MFSRPGIERAVLSLALRDDNILSQLINENIQAKHFSIKGNSIIYNIILHLKFNLNIEKLDAMLMYSTVKDEKAKPLIIFVDDDFETLDLIDIYLKRDYTYESFSGPREAVFFLNHHTPEIVFVDCKIHTMKALTFMEIVRTGAGNENVPFVLVGTEEELEEFNLDYLPEYVIGKLKRPVARKELMEFITKVTSKKEEE